MFILSYEVTTAITHPTFKQFITSMFRNRNDMNRRQSCERSAPKSVAYSLPITNYLCTYIYKEGRASLQQKIGTQDRRLKTVLGDTEFSRNHVL